MRISTESLGKRFNREWIFKNLNYTFESGNTYAVIGPNGSGKSTLLQILWGQLPPSAGLLKYHEGETAIPADDIFRYLSIATPYQELIEEFTLVEMLSFHFKFKRARNNISPAEMMDKLELGHAADKPISNFSSGMRQRLKLGLAFYADTPILFFDEPTTNLDKKSIIWYNEQLRLLPDGLLVFIASNQEQEYPPTAQKIDISIYK